MYSPGRGDARATAPPNARDSSTSMPIDHASAWQREPYNRDVRLDRVDRDRIVGKREWNSDRPSSGAPYQRAFGGLHPVNGSLGPPNKRRLNGRHSGFHTENGRYGSAGHRGEPSPFGSIPPLENGLARKFDRDFYPGSGCAVASTGFSNGPGLDHRSKDSEERHKRDSFPVSGDGRDGGSSAVNDQPVRPYHSQALSEVENSSWERDRSKGLISSGSWDSSQRSERDHRERFSGKPDPYSSRREGKFSQYDSGRDWSQSDRDLDGTRLDRYGSSSRDSFSSDTLGGAKDLPLGFEWRRKERSSSVSVSRTSAYIASNGSTKETLVRPQGLDVSGSAPSPQHSPHSTPSSTVHEPSRDDGNHPSPPKRPRLGWGQGLAKYEKKKVVETDEIATSSPGVTVSESGRSVISAALSGTTTETLLTQEVHAAEESPVSVVSNPTMLPVLTPTTSSLQQALESVSKSTVESQIVEQDVIGKQSEKVEDEADKPAACSSLPCVASENVVKRSDVCAGTESICEVAVRQPDSSESVDKPTAVKEPSSCQASPFSPSVIEQSSAVDLTQEVSSLGDVVGWTKEAILLRVEKVESEIELVEKEISKLEKVESPNITVNTESVEEVLAEVTVAKSEQVDDGPQAMDEDDGEVSAPIRDSRESSQLVHGASPVRNFSPTTESNLKVHGEGAVGEVVHQLDTKSVEDEDASMLDQAAVFEEGELHEEKKEQATVTPSLHDSESEWSLMSSPSADTELASEDQMNQFMSVSKAEVEDKEESNLRMDMRDPLVFASTLMEENKRQALQASQSFMHLLTPDLSQGGKLYSCPSEALVWKENAESHIRNQEKLLEKLTEQKQTQKFTERILTMRFRAFKDAWRQEQLGLSQQQRGTKPVRRWELEKRNGTSLSCQRSSLRLRPVQSGTGKLEAVSEEHMKKLMVDPVVGQLRPILKMPAMILGEKERLARRFVSKNALVEDPVKVELERKTVNPWTAEEKKTFLEKFAVYNKNFSKIASHLEYKTTADCVEFYYRNQKSEDFEKIRRRQQLKKRRDYSRVGGSYLATGLPTSSRQREANAHARAEALNGQTAASVVTITHISAGAKAVRSSIHHKPADRIRISSSIDPASLPPTLELGKSLSGKENKFSVTPLVSTCAAVPTSTVGSAAASVTISCGLSSAIPPVKISRERSSMKSMSNGGQVVARTGSLEQHTSGPKGARSIHIRRDLAKSAGEEADAQWTDRERELFTEAVAMFGKNFQSIALHVGPTKNLGQCKSFFSKTRKRLGLDHLVEKYQAKLRSSAEAVVVKNSECVDVQMEEVLPAVSEDVLSASLRVNCVSMPMEEGNHGNKSPEHHDHDEHDELEEEIANALKLSDSKATDEEASEPAATEVLSQDVTIETSVCLAESIAEIENVAKVYREVAATASTMDDCCLEESVDLNPELAMPESVHEEEQVKSQVPKVEETEDVPTGSDTTSLAASGVLEEEVAREAPKLAESVVESPKCEAEAVAGIDVGALVKTSNMIADQQEPKPISAVAVKPEPGSPQVAMSASTDSASFPSVPAALSHSAGAIFSTTSSIHSAQQARERVGRVGSGETKPRREPTSWTQEEKEKFADIIRNHGKDWTKLHDCLPAKSLTQIKTYFQNSKAKLGLLNPEGLNISGGRGAGSRKRKADDSDTTSSNNVGSLTTTNEFKSGSILPSDADVASQKVSPAMTVLPSITAAMSMGTSVVGTDSLPYSLFGQRMDDPMTVQKFIRQMCSSGTGFSQNPQAIYPFLHQHGLPMFSNSGLQRAPHSNLQQQLAASLSQKSSQSIGVQQPLQSAGGVQQSPQPNLHQQAAHQLQTAQVARSQQQLLQNMMQQQAAAHLQQQQQHQTSKGVLHPLQQQVVVLQQGQATQRQQQQQQQQQLLNQQVVHHPQAQQASSQQQQASSAQQIVTQGLTAGASPQVSNQLKQFQQHQQALLQQQHQFQQAVQHLQQQQQLQQHQQEQAQAQAQAQVQAQGQAHTHIHQHQSSHAPLIQPLVATKPKGLVPLPQQLTKSLSTPALQQGSLLHRHDQLQHGPALSLLRESVQSAAPSNSGDASNHQEDIGELRGINSNGASKRREFSRASIEQQLSAAVQRASPSQQAVVPQRPTPTPATELQHSRPADVKLFGQSLLCQPTSTASTQTATRPLASSSAERTSPVYTTSSSPVTSMSVPSATAPKGYGKDSAFRGVPFIPDGRQAQWPSPGLWNMMHPKGSEGELEQHHREPEASLKTQHIEPQPRIEGLATTVHGLDKTRDQGGASENGSSVRASRGQQQPEAFPAAAAAAAPPQVPRTVINALMAIADWHQSRSLQSHSQPRLDDHQWETIVRQGLAAAAGGAAADALKLPFSGDGGMYFTPPQHYPNNTSAWTSGAGLVHHPEVQRMLVNPALTPFLPGALSRAPTATEEHLGSATESRDPDSSGGGAG